MHVDLVTPPDDIITLAEAKRHLRVDGDDEDEVISGIISGILANLDGPMGWLGRALGRQTLIARMDGCDLWPNAKIDLPLPPFFSLTSFVYDDEVGVERAVSTSDIVVTRYGQKARLLPAYGACWPSPRRYADAVRITWVAGYDPAARELAPARSAALLMIGHHYEHREAVMPSSLREAPARVQSLLAPMRVWGGGNVA